MDKCDKCGNMARVTVSGAILPACLCALHASQLCESVGDSTGADKFKLLIQGDKAVTYA